MTLRQTINDRRSELMGLAALWIMMYHVWLLVLSDTPVLGEIEHYVKLYGFTGVDIFFLLSGMGLTGSMRKHSAAGFYYRRIRRIAFPYIIASIGYAILRKWSVMEFIRAFTGIGFFAGDENGDFLWFVPAIVICYLVFPLYYKVISASKHPVVLTAVLSLVFGIISLLLFDLAVPQAVGRMTQRIPVFLTGILIGINDDIGNIRIGRKLTAVFVSVLAICIFITAFKPFTPGRFTPLITGVMGVMTAVLFCMLMSRTGEGFLPCRFLRLTGSMSFEIYCINVVLFEFLIIVITGYGRQYFAFRPDMLINITSFVLTLIVSWLVYKANNMIFGYIDKRRDKNESGR